MNIADIAPTDDARYGAERVFIAGSSGTGKSMLTAKLIAAIPSARDKRGKAHGWCVVVVDSKHDWEYRRWWQREGASPWERLPLTDLRLVADGHYVYRPRTFPERADAGARRIFRTCLQRRYCVIVVDELADFGATAGIAELGKMIRQARAKHVIVICGTQRPTGVVLLAITEANKLFCFKLGSRDDYDRLAKWGDPHFAEPPSGVHDFNFFDRRSRRFVRVEQTEGAA